jgi:hypothetical protein
MMTSTNTEKTATTIPTSEPHPTVQLTGRDGHALAIFSACKRAARKAGWSHDQLAALQKEMLSGDYDHVLATACKYFDVD